MQLTYNAKLLTDPQVRNNIIIVLSELVLQAMYVFYELLNFFLPSTWHTLRSTIVFRCSQKFHHVHVYIGFQAHR